MRFRGIISETGRIRKFDNIMTAISKIARSCVLQFDHGWCKDNFNPSHPSNKHNYFTFLWVLMPVCGLVSWWIGWLNVIISLRFWKVFQKINASTYGIYIKIRSALLSTKWEICWAVRVSGERLIRYLTLLDQEKPWICV